MNIVNIAIILLQQDDVAKAFAVVVYVREMIGRKEVM